MHFGFAFVCDLYLFLHQLSRFCRHIKETLRRTKKRFSFFCHEVLLFLLRFLHAFRNDFSFVVYDFRPYLLLNAYFKAAGSTKRRFAAFCLRGHSSWIGSRGEYCKPPWEWQLITNDLGRQSPAKCFCASLLCCFLPRLSVPREFVLKLINSEKGELEKSFPRWKSIKSGKSLLIKPVDGRFPSIKWSIFWRATFFNEKKNS